MLRPRPAGQILSSQERPDEARALLEQAIDIWSRVETAEGQPFDAYLRSYFGNTALALLAARRGDHPEARARLAEGLPLLRTGGDQWDLALLLLNSGLEEAQAASPTAASLLIEALRAWQQLGSTAGVAFTLGGLAEIAAQQGAPRRAG